MSFYSNSCARSTASSRRSASRRVCRSAMRSMGDSSIRSSSGGAGGRVKRSSVPGPGPTASDQPMAFV